MKRLLTTAFVLFILSGKLSAQDAGEIIPQKEWSERKTIIAGKVLNFDPRQERRTLTVLVPHLIERARKYAAVIDEEGKFSVEIRLAYPMEFNIQYGSIAALLCSPGDSLYIEIDGDIWKDRRNEMPNGNYFVQVKNGRSLKASNDIIHFLHEKPITDYAADNRISAIKNKSPEEYKAFIEQREEVYRAYLKEFTETNKPGSLFLQWANDHLKYESWESLLHYRWTHFPDRESQASLPAHYFSFLEKYEMNDRQVISTSHAGFLSEFYQYTVANPADSSKKAEILFDKGLIIEGAGILKRQIQHYTEGFTRELFLTKLYLDALAGQQQEVFEALYKPGELEGPYFKNLINKQYAAVKSYLANQTPTGANLSRLNNEIVAPVADSIASKYMGKVVYIDFWAPWCTPCMAEMPNSKKLQEHFRQKEVVFLFLASQCSEESWKSTIANENLTGEHIRLTNDQYKILSAEFGISGIPHHVLIDRNGNFIIKNAPGPGDSETKDLISKLLK